MSPLGQTPPRPADPTPCSLLPGGARARGRARKSGVGAECGQRPGWVRHARRRRAGQWSAGSAALSCGAHRPVLPA